MTDRELEKRIRTAVQHAAPNAPEEVLSRCSERKGAVFTMTEQKHSKKTKFGIAAAVAVCLAFVFLIGGMQTPEPFTLVTLDVNPGIQLSLDEKEEVLRADALNDDAKPVLQQLNLSGRDAGEAVGLLIDSLVETGYIREDANSVLISVQSKDPAAAARMQKMLGRTADDAMKADSVDGAVLSQILNDDDALEELAEANGMSEGRARMIRRVTELNPNLTFEQLRGMNVSELHLLLNEDGDELLEITGTPSESGYIGREAALAAALKAAGVSADDIQNPDVEFDVENGVLVYEAEFTVSGTEYEYEIDAVTGAVLDAETEPEDADDDDADDDDKDDPDNDEPVILPEGCITPEQAKAAALKHAGISSAEKIEVKPDYENGKAVYEVEFKLNGMEYEYDIDAATGAVLKTETEPDD